MIYNSGIEIPRVQFSLINYVQIASGSYFLGFEETTFEDLDNNARVWIYQSNREFSNNEVEIIKEKTSNFIENWLRHGDHLKASFFIKYNQFIILAVDENFNEVFLISLHSVSIPSSSFCIPSGLRDRSLIRKNQLCLMTMLVHIHEHNLHI